MQVNRMETEDAGPEQLECVCFTLIVDDIVLPHGETVMEVLGGGGPQTLFGYQLVTNQTAAVGLSAGIGPDLPARCKDWLLSIGANVSGLVPHGRPTPRAWQVFEEWGRRTQIWRGRDDPCDELYDMLRPRYDTLPASFRRSRNYHLGLHPLHPPLRLMRQLRRAAHENGGAFSVEPYTAAESPATPEQVSALLAECDIFSPNEAEAVSLVGPGSPLELAARLLSLSPPGGAALVVIRCGPEGVLAARRGRRAQQQQQQQQVAQLVEQQAEQPCHLPAVQPGLQQPGEGATEVDEEDAEAYEVPAVADTRVVDVTGCGNAFCGGFLAALYRGRHPASPSDSSTDTSSNFITNSNRDHVPACENPMSPSSPPPSLPLAPLPPPSPRSPPPSPPASVPAAPAWLLRSELAGAAAWGCVAASFMAEERGVPATGVRQLQPRAHERFRQLLPRVKPVRLTKATCRMDGAERMAARAQSSISTAFATMQTSSCKGAAVLRSRMRGATGPHGVRALHM